MTKFLLAGVLSLALGSVSVHAQASNPDPNANHSDVYLDNHRPLIQHKDKAPTTRTVTGKVVDDSGTPVEGALVTLTNDKTAEKRTSITKAGGRFDFDDVSFTVDYELDARYKDQITDKRKLSQYDHSAKVVRILTLAPNTASRNPSDHKF